MPATEVPNSDVFVPHTSKMPYPNISKFLPAPSCSEFGLPNVLMKKFFFCQNVRLCDLPNLKSLLFMFFFSKKVTRTAILSGSRGRKQSRVLKKF